MPKTKKQTVGQKSESVPKVDVQSQDELYDDDTSDVEVISKVIGVILIVINVAWLIVIAPAIYNTLFPKF